jgi:hypothetical protein
VSGRSEAEPLTVREAWRTARGAGEPVNNLGEVTFKPGTETEVVDPARLLPKSRVKRKFARIHRPDRS